MAFPYLFEESFEAATLGNFDATTDTQSKIFFRKYTDVARITSADGAAEVPFRGAFAMHVDLSLGTADAYIQENTGYDTALGGTIFVRFYFYASKNITMATNDRFTIFTMQSTTNVDQVVVDVRNSAGTIQILASNTGSSGTVRAVTLPLGQWNLVELKAVIDSGAPNDGTIDFYFNGSQVGTQITALDQLAIDQGRLGAIGIDAGTTLGNIFFDSMVADDLRVRGISYRFAPYSMWITANGHAVVGPGRARVTLTGTGTNAVLNLYDTDDANTSQYPQLITVMRNVNANELVQMYEPISFNKGLYCEISGTNAQAEVFIERAPNWSDRTSAVNYALTKTVRVAQ